MIYADWLGQQHMGGTTENGRPPKSLPPRCTDPPGERRGHLEGARRV